MKTRQSLQAGFGHVAVVFLIVFVAVVGFAGYKVMSSNSSKQDASVAVPVAASTVPAQIKTKADLVQTAKVLDNSSSSVDSTLNDTALSSDLNDML
jgi:hypothetical protein